MYCSEIKTYYLAINKVPERLSERVPSTVTCYGVRFASSNSPIVLLVLS